MHLQPNGVTSTSDSTYLDNFSVYNGDGIGSSEVEWTAKYKTSCSENEDPDITSTIRFTGIDEDDWHFRDMNAPWIGAVPKNDECILVELRETDAVADDDWGSGTMTAVTMTAAISETARTAAIVLMDATF